MATATNDNLNIHNTLQVRCIQCKRKDRSVKVGTWEIDDSGIVSMWLCLRDGYIAITSTTPDGSPGIPRFLGAIAEEL